MKKLTLGIMTLLLCAACDGKSIDGTKERASAESEASREVENSNQAKKAERMEADLAARHRYYAAIEGRYEGDIDVNGQAYKMRVTFQRSIPPYTGGRVRQLSEIESDLNGLSFNVQVVQWDPADEDTAVGCRLGEVRPNFGRGQMAIYSSSCPSAYTFLLSREGRSNGSKENQARDVAEGVTNGQVSQVTRLVGTVQPTSNASTYTLDVKRSN